MKKDDEKRLTPEEAVSQIDLDHIQEPYKTRINTLFTKHHNLLTKSEYDICP